MSETVEIIVYQIDELTAEAKERARNWYRATAIEDGWYDHVYDDFKTVCEILGFTLAVERTSLATGFRRSRSCISFSGFWGQGDGACFEGRYRYSKGSNKAIRDYAPTDKALHRIADQLKSIQRRYFYQLEATIRQRGRYNHEHSMEISVAWETRDYLTIPRDDEDGLAEAMRDLARWLYGQLEKEYEYLTSPEAVDDVIIANGYKFTEAGAIFG
jgi:hypothetical protein